jgi:hypothetical protein
MAKKLKYWLEYLVLRGFAALLNALPYRIALAVAWGASSFLFHVIQMKHFFGKVSISSTACG